MVDISIISMVKNEEHYIESSVTSIISQNVNLELIIVDDNSTDKTLEILKKIEKEHKNIKVMENDKKGKVNAFLKGCSYANGKYLAFFAGDDIMPKESLKQRLDCISTMESPAVLLSKLRVMSDDKSIDGMILPKKDSKGSTSGAAIMIDKLAAEYLLDIPTTLPNEDTWMELCISNLDFLNVKSQNVVACNWRVHQGNSNSIRQNYKTFNERFSARMKAIEIFYNKYNDILSEEKKKKVNALIKSEAYRSDGRFMKILFLPLKPSDKLRFVLYSNKYFFKIKKLIRSV